MFSKLFRHNRHTTDELENRTRTLTPYITIVSTIDSIQYPIDILTIYPSFTSTYIINSKEFNLEWSYQSDNEIHEQDTFLHYIDTVVVSWKANNLHLETNFGITTIDYNKSNLKELLCFMKAINHVWTTTNPT